ncbi:unnamed protein product [Acanthoscelides obtectus]|uniref:Uncharacterized protein n=1 Tax=Acanthoscelides obtectus TaxID=200917 RepID=A0A9P0KWE1_ACAOB|nr:unnamed protein product [Acanthoscelides obtectus]CAK1641665.1 hypothetical protein AOBTE_LOCUS12543 [Acanthoscelides obtectus]
MRELPYVHILKFFHLSQKKRSFLQKIYESGTVIVHG